MNKPIIFFKKIITLFLIGITVTACNHKEKILPPLSPDDYMYMQRAYPYETIDQKSVLSCRKDVKKLLSETSVYDKNNNTWESEGPTNIGGRVTAIARNPVDAEMFYIGCSVGGVWKTADGGDSWSPIFDDVITPSIGALAASPSDPKIIYAGTGEANGSATSGAFIGSGVYRSEDSGDTWTAAGLEQSNHIGRMVVSQSDPNVVIAAATGKLYGKCPNRGVYRTVNGGEDWEQLLFVSDSTACIDVVMHPTNHNIIYAAMWERERMAWIRDYGGPTSGIYRTTDGGSNWTRLENGLPDNIDSRGRIGLSLCKSDPNILYATMTDNEITNTFYGVYITDNRGESWEDISTNLPSSTFSSFGWFFGNISCNPTDDEDVYVLGLNAFKKGDDGDNWRQIQGMHVDMHAIDHYNGDSDDILIGNDGGLYRSIDGGLSFRFISNIPITMLYNIEMDFQKPERIFGGTQDNNSIGTFTGNDNDYERLLGGDGFHINVDPRNSNLIYAESQFGGLRKSTDGGQNFSDARDGIDSNDRNNWNTPVILSPTQPDILYYGTQRVYRSFQAESWTAISEDLTDGMHPSGSRTFSTITTIAPSHSNLNVIYAGADDGNISVTQNGGFSWERVSANLPDRYVTKISVNPNVDSEAIATFSGYRYLEYEPHIMITYDYGVSWTDISGNLPSFPINDIEYDPIDDMTLYIATDMGVWYTKNKGLDWQILGKDLAPTIVNDIKIHAPTSRMIAGTFGRSIYSLDISQLTSVSIENPTPDITLYPNPSREGQVVNLRDVPGINQVVIHDIKGNKISEKTNVLSIDENLAAGVYLITAITENGRHTKKLIVQ